MGARSPTLLAALAAAAIAGTLVTAPRPAHADDCVAGAEGKRFATCFDPGNRLVVEAGTGDAWPSAWFGGAIALRHVVRTDDPGLTWRFEHVILAAGADAARFRVVAYELRTLRHARDGHLVLPTSPPKKLFLPFDIGLETTVAALAGERGATTARLGMVRTAVVLDLARSPDFRRRIAVGAAVRWDVVVDRERTQIAEHLVAPFSVGELAVHLESRDGLSVLALGAQAGVIWSDTRGWIPTGAVSGSVERVLLGVNDLPVSIYAESRLGDDDGVSAMVGLRLALLSRRHGPAGARRE